MDRQLKQQKGPHSKKKRKQKSTTFEKKGNHKEQKESLYQDGLAVSRSSKKPRRQPREEDRIITKSNRKIVEDADPLYNEATSASAPTSDSDLTFGFSRIAAEKIPNDFHLRATEAFEKLRHAHYYQYDIVMAGGKILSRTFVRRTLVGDPGITYKYLGLRLFAHPWSGRDATPLCRNIYGINQYMIRQTEIEMKKQNITQGSCQYNLTLINFMEPTTEVEFKEDSKLGKVAVSWHADSSLEPTSSIGVYQCLPSQNATHPSASKWDWKIALRRNPDTNSKDHASNNVLVVPTNANEMYFLLGDFNDRNQHMVLAGNSSKGRISSTHRVAVTESDTYGYIYRRAKHAKKHFKIQLRLSSVKEWNREEILECMRIHTEVECQWIRQYWIQGAEHDAMRPWWQAPMRELEDIWKVLESCTFKLVEICTTNGRIPQDLLQDILQELVTRQEQREKWTDREQDKIYKRRMTRAYQPVLGKPSYPEKSIGHDLGHTVEMLRSMILQK